MNPLFLYGAVALALASASAGWKVRDWQCDAAVAKAIAKAEERRLQTEAQVAYFSAKYENMREAAYIAGAGRVEMVRELYRNVEVPANCAVPSAAYSLLANSVRDANAASPGQSGEVMSANPDAANAAH